MTGTKPGGSAPMPTTVTATYAGTVLARAERTVFLEGNHYFPRETVDEDALEKSWLRTLCYWKGIARYYHVQAGGHRITNAAWAYPLPSPLAGRIRNMVAFDTGTGILVQEQPGRPGSP
ncbi:DUF427 domain-containing protein [Pseudarthrobacter enclensis]|uniref:Uncharacterized protein (DUF427 family) n=1 Tax=Pseudarthrobacter enclensis TaxID=993070 RepID=A0ABT9RY17_9MICC|nr:DUF427 domain-containing protein [Pseudarthrobacter enclensis]MDP9890146.1 uncharacterized protein (DUF427 family) [Pseudarthrobacter enclensis]